MLTCLLMMRFTTSLMASIYSKPQIQFSTLHKTYNPHPRERCSIIFVIFLEGEGVHLKALVMKSLDPVLTSSRTCYNILQNVGSDFPL